MTDTVRSMMNAEPFVPFMIKTSDGKHYRVKHPDYVSISPKGGRISVSPNEDDVVILSALHLVAVEPESARKKAVKAR